ncbi:MAG: type II toxin-antitoxin system HicB family antitoxin [Clostridiales bacterium]|nr:type II toxin-antitoxin system HicB family antitoxin [Clostridiales bacterium]
MRFIYPAVFRPEEDGKYRAFFPDLECCEAKGDTLEDAIENANAAAYDWIYTEITEFEGILPPVSDLSDIQLQDGEVVRNISVIIRVTEGWDE